MAWTGGIDWAKKLQTKVPVQETVRNTDINLNNLPAFVFIDGRQWWRTTNLSQTRTYSYVKCPSQNVADAMVDACDHITVSGNSNNQDSYVILNAHITYLDGSPRVHYYPSSNTYSDNPPPKELREFVTAVFFKVITVMK